MDDDDLIAALAAGDDTALRELFDRHAPWLAARLRAALPPPDIEDVLQETFLAVWKGASGYRPRGTPQAWMWVIARNQAALLLRRRGRSFGKNKAVDGVSVELGPGVFGLLGPNGAGKTSLLRMLATVLPPSSGQIRLLDRDPRGPAARREIRRRLGYLPQNLGYYPSFTVVEFIEYFALLKEMPSAVIPKAVAVAVERVDLGAKAKAKLRTLSGGMLRRVGIAQAIVNEPDLLLLDEPTAGLDPEQRVQFRALLRSLGESATVIVSTHLVEDVGGVLGGGADVGREDRVPRHAGRADRPRRGTRRRRRAAGARLQRGAGGGPVMSAVSMSPSPLVLRP
jgi:ABC-2 type transport system ATP-binding protein